MTTLQDVQSENGKTDWRDSDTQSYEQLIERLEHQREELKNVAPTEISSSEIGKKYIELLKGFREAVARILENNGKNYPELLKSILSVGEDGLYSNNLRFIFELIQNVDDCDFNDAADCKLDMRFDFNNDEIILTYDEVGFTPFNVFAITGIAEEAKNILSGKNQIGEKGIGFKSVFGVADKVWIKSGWFSFELYKDNYTIPIPVYDSFDYISGTQIILYVPPRKARQIYNEIKDHYCKKDALFSQNPILFLNKLTSLKIYNDVYRSMEFHVSRTENEKSEQFRKEKNIEISVDLHHHDSSSDKNIPETKILCTRYTYSVVFSKEACRARYGEKTKVGQENGKAMTLSAVIPDIDFISEIGNGALYSFLPTQLKLTVPIAFHVPFKLDASREFVDPQENNLWFQEASNYLSELMKEVYLDYCKTAKEDIIRYLPSKRDSIFANNNGKEKCLTEQKCFNGAHYLDLPILYTIDGEYKKAEEVFCFDESEKITEPDRVCRLMEYLRSLFNASTSNKFAIEIKKNVKDEMFKKALMSADKTDDILDYLDSVNYEYNEKLISQIAPIKILQAQAYIILKHSKLTDLLRNICCKAIKKNKRFELKIVDAAEQIITDVLGDEFEMSDIPKDVRQYMEYCHKKCICIDELSDIFLPCYNAILLSSQTPKSSFLSFCRSIDPNDPFTTRMTWREKSNELNEYVEDLSISENEYMRVLRQIRLSIQDSLGEEGYRNYLDIILKSGTDRGRFIQEILQNADDCSYLQDVTPSFSLSVKGQTIITEYNETGFTRANIRSITAIGESTKKKLLSNLSNPIGEKGVGFKTIFAIASKVTIHSGDYHFSLSDKEPTIPKVLNETNTETVSGTRMEIQLKNNYMLPDYKEKEILELCLCLRNLKKLTIGKHTIIISDTEDKRTIKIGNRIYFFKRFYHNFTITNEDALEERKKGGREISAEQQIMCYVPEGTQFEFPLYCGLPTKHKIKIPMAIDAPFSLTTSREEIETEGSVWNDIIRREMYTAIINVIDALKKEDRASIFNFLRFVPRLQGNIRAYVNDIFDNKYLNGYDFLSVLRTNEILPTFNRNVFAIPIQQNAHRFPACAIYIFEKLSLIEYEGINASSIIDIRDGDYESALNALECKEADFPVVFTIISRYAEQFICEESFRKTLYEYLMDAPEEYREKIKELKIIPVYSKEGNSTDYISWIDDDRIVVKTNILHSEDNYYVLNEKQLLKSDCEKIFGTYINVMSIKEEHDRYNSKLKDKICGDDDIVSVYNYLISEYHCGRLLKNESFDTLIANGIPLKNQLGVVTCNNLFICDQSGYFTTKMIKGLIVHDECRGLAKDIKTKELKNIHYEDIQYYEELTEDDIEALIDEPNHYFENYEEILRRFYYDNLISDELLQVYGIEYIQFHSHDTSISSYDFPSEPVGNRKSLVDHIKKLCSAPPEIINEIEPRTVQKIKNSGGKPYSIDSKKARDVTMNRYSPEGENDKCFCQMCRDWKYKEYIEVNNIEKTPNYFFGQLRIALCLECSKNFEKLRDNKSVREAFLKKIKEYDIDDEYDESIEIPIGDKKITFTAKHLAEIQEILKQKPKS